VLKQKSEQRTATLVNSAWDQEHNKSLVLKRVLECPGAKDEG